MSGNRAAGRVLDFLCIDDHALFRAGMRYLLQELPNPIRLEETSSLEEGLEALRNKSFDLVLLDLIMPEGDPRRLLREVLAGASQTPVLVLSSSDDPDLIHMAFENGATGFLPKSASPEVMVHAVSLVLSGGIYVPPAVLKLLQFKSRNGGQRTDSPKPAALTEQQRKVLEHLAQGASNKQIARALGISESTVKTHVTSIFKLLQAQNRAQAVVLATHRGLIS